MFWIITYIALSGVSNLLILSWVYFKSESTPFRTSFLIFIFFNTSWIFGNLAMVLSDKVFFFRAVHALGFWAACFALIWVLSLNKPEKRLSKTIVVPLYLSSIIISIACFTNGVFFVGENTSFLNLQLVYSEYFVVYQNCLIAVLLFTLFCLVYFFIRPAKQKSRKQVFYIFLGLATYYSIAIFGIVMAERGYPNYGYLDSPSSIFFTLATAYTITKTKFFNIQAAVTNISAALVSLSIFLMISISITYSSIPIFQKLIILNFCIVAAIVFGESLKKGIMTGLRHAFIKGYFDPDKTFKKISKSISKEKDRSKLFHSVQNILDNDINFEELGLIHTVRKPDENLSHYHLEYTPPSGATQSQKLTLDNPLISFFNEHTEIIKLHQLDTNLQDVLGTYSFHKESIIIPFRSLECLEGILIFGERSGGIKLKATEQDFLITIQNFVNAILFGLTPLEKAESKYLATQKQLHDAEIQILRSKNNESLAHMRQQFCHEINTPLNIIKQEARELEDSSGNKAIKKSIIEEVDNAAEIVRETLKLGDAEELPDRIETNVNINDAIERCFTLLPAKGYKLEKELGELPKTLGVHRDLQMVFTNLMKNAIEAMPKGGIITIKSYQNNNDIYVDFSDTGVGIDKEQLTRIWEPYVSGNQTDYGNDTGGRGWGLTIINRIIEEHHGHVSVQSQKGEGSTFTIRLPIRT